MVDIEKKLVFGAASGPDGLVVLIGIPDGALDTIRDGRTQNFDLTKIGIGLKVIVYGGADHATCKKVIDDHNAKNNTATLDLRREDFTIKEKRP